ncbi:MAG: CBS domain-containing protein [Cyanobacteria bacterium P01_E01_bin.6]
MTRPVVVIRSSATVENAIWLMRANRVRSLIVETSLDDGCYGILTEKDIVFKVIALGYNPSFTRVSSIMRQPCIQIPYNATVQEAAQIPADSGIHRAPVMDHNELLGIVSVTDILLKGSLTTLSQDELSQRIQDALRHARIIDDEDAQMKQECDIAWQVLEDMRLGSSSAFR